MSHYSSHNNGGRGNNGYNSNSNGGRGSYTKKPSYSSNYNSSGQSQNPPKPITQAPRPNPNNVDESWGSSHMNAEDPWRSAQSSRVRSFPKSKTAYDPESSSHDSSLNTDDGWMKTTKAVKRDGYANKSGESEFNVDAFRKGIKRDPVNARDNTYDQLGISREIFETDEELSALNELQQEVVKSVVLGNLSVFFSGPAGTGKSKIVSTISRLNDMRSKPKKIILTATTGIAACNIGGSTIHSFAGVGTGQDRLEVIAGKVLGNQYTVKRWKSCDILIIDEISMMQGNFLDMLDFVAKRVRSDKRPFGGIQLVLCGDFFQLPPIDLRNGFAFEAKCWNDVIRRSVLLTHIYRQNGDNTLMDILGEARVGMLSDKSMQILDNHVRNPPKMQRVKGVSRNGNNVYYDGISALTDTQVTPATSTSTSALNGEREGEGVETDIVFTRLECRNVDVDKANVSELNKLAGKCETYTCEDMTVSSQYDSLLRNCNAPETITLKIGAQVMLLKNLDPDKGLVNGSRGVVVGFKQPEDQLNYTKAFRNKEFPVVNFSGINDFDAVTIRIDPQEYTNTLQDMIVAKRTQLPLKLAWSLSVHKSQGMTIPNLEISLSGVFEYGQGYVALSRATKLDQLVLKGYDMRSFKSHPRVRLFYSALEGGDGDGAMMGVQENSSSSSSASSMAMAMLGKRKVDSSSSGGVAQDTQGFVGFGSSSGKKAHTSSGLGAGSGSRPGNGGGGGGVSYGAASMKIGASAGAGARLGAPSITDEQKKKMEENRKKALAIREAKVKMQQREVEREKEYQQEVQNMNSKPAPKQQQQLQQRQQREEDKTGSTPDDAVLIN